MRCACASAAAVLITVGCLDSLMLKVVLQYPFLKDLKAFRLRYVVSQKDENYVPILSPLILLFKAGRLEAHYLHQAKPAMRGVLAKIKLFARSECIIRRKSLL